MDKIWFKELAWWIEFDEFGNLICERIERPTFVLQQCQTTTKIKSAKCWQLSPPMCGYHAAMIHPEMYPKAKGHQTGGRHGKGNNTIPLNDIPIITARKKSAGTVA